MIISWRCSRRKAPATPFRSALAAAYHRLAFQTLADQVRRSVRSVRGNQWMFRMGHPADHPLRIRPELLRPDPADGTYPILRECTPVRMDLTHCGWSDIFFLGMDFPEGAKVLNVSIDLGVHGRDAAPRPPVEAYLRVIDEPVLRLASVDLGATADITNLAEVFDFAKDYLGLLKAAVIAAGIVPPGIEGSGQSLADLLARIVGPGRGLEIVSNVNNIPKGSRLAVSTNLLAALISVCMRATGQAASLTGQLQEHERRLVLARALLGEWLGGSGGGWQDSGGVWPGMKLIEGVLAERRRPGVRHQPRPAHAAAPHSGPSRTPRPRRAASCRTASCSSTAAWRRTSGRSWRWSPRNICCAATRNGRRARACWASSTRSSPPCARGDVRAIGARDHAELPPAHPDHHPLGDATTSPRRSSTRVRAEFGDDFWGFWMLGGMSGGGMGFIFAPEQQGARRSSACRKSCPPPNANCSTRCPLPWSRWSMTSPSTSAAPSPTCSKAARR